MKRLLATSLALALALSLTACGGGGTSSSSTPANSSPAQSAATSSNQEIEVDKNLLSVDITLPASMFEGEDMTTFDANAYATENGFNKAVLNDDGSVSINMSKAKHNELMSELKKSLKESFSDMIGSEDTPYIKDIRHSDSYDSVNVIVDKAGYEAGGFMTAFIPFTIYVQTAMYQTFAGDEQHCTVSIVDEATSETIEAVSYPEALENAG